MTVTLIGSRAIKRWFPDFREPKDWDWLCENGWEWRGDGVPRGWTFPEGIREAKHDVLRDSRFGQYPCWQDVATPDESYTMKISHGFWDIHGTWDKHARDIVFLQRKGCTFNRKLYDILVPVWTEWYKKNNRVLNKSKDEFFADAVKRKYDHDSVHESVAYGERPLYESILADGAQVKVDNSKFWAMDLETQLNCVREEVYATALERILIPGNYRGSPGAAYWWALRRTATSLFKGEWALFLLLHLDELRRPDCNYMQRHLENTDRLRPIGEDSE